METDQQGSMEHNVMLTHRLTACFLAALSRWKALSLLLPLGASHVLPALWKPHDLDRWLFSFELTDSSQPVNHAREDECERKGGQ